MSNTILHEFCSNCQTNIFLKRFRRYFIQIFPTKLYHNLCIKIIQQNVFYHCHKTTRLWDFVYFIMLIFSIPLLHFANAVINSKRFTHINFVIFFCCKFRLRNCQDIYRQTFIYTVFLKSWFFSLKALVNLTQQIR